MRSFTFFVPVLVLASGAAMAGNASTGQERAAALLSRSLQAPVPAQSSVLVTSQSRAAIDAQTLAARLLSRPATTPTIRVGVALNRPSTAWGAPRA